MMFARPPILASSGAVPMGGQIPWPAWQPGTPAPTYDPRVPPPNPLSSASSSSTAPYVVTHHNGAAAIVRQPPARAVPPPRVPAPSTGVAAGGGVPPYPVNVKVTPTRKPPAKKAAPPVNPAPDTVGPYVPPTVQNNPFTITGKVPQSHTDVAGILKAAMQLGNGPQFSAQQVLQMLGAMNPRQMAKLARQMAKQDFQAPQQALLDQQTLNDRNVAAQQASAHGFSLAEARMLKPIAGDLSHIYDNSASTMGAIAQGLTGDAQAHAIADTGTQNDLLSRTGGGQNIQHPLASDDAHNAMYALTGAMPATSLTQAGAAYSQAAANAPENVLDQGRQEAQLIGAQGSAADHQIALKLADLMAKQPADAQKILAALNSNDQHVRGAALSFLEKQNTDSVHAKQLAAHIGLEGAAVQQRDNSVNATNARHDQDVQVKIDDINQKAQQWQTRFNLDATKDARTELRDNRAWYASLANIGIKNRGLALKATQAQMVMARGGRTPHDYLVAGNEAANAAYNFFHGWTVTGAKAKDPEADKSGASSSGKGWDNTYQPKSYKYLVEQMIRRNIPISIWLPAAANYYPEAAAALQKMKLHA